MLEHDIRQLAWVVRVMGGTRWWEEEEEIVSLRGKERKRQIAVELGKGG